MTTAIGTVNAPPAPTNTGQRPPPSSPADSQASFAQFLAPLGWVSTPPAATGPAAIPTIRDGPAAQKDDEPNPDAETSARSHAQELTSTAGATVAAASSQRLFQSRGAERPNEVNLAGRAAAELASHNEPASGDPTGETATSRAAAPRPTGTKSEASPPDAPQPRAATPEAARAELSGTPPVPGPGHAGITAAPSAHAASEAGAIQAGPVQGIAPGAAAPRQPVVANSASAVAPLSGPAAANSARSTGAEARGGDRHDGSSPAAARARMWSRLERLGQRPDGPVDPRAASRSTDRPSVDSTVQAQLARGLAAALRQRDGHVTLRLNPENLGHVRVDLSIQADRITASIAAADEQARRLLSADVVTLRAALEASGLNVEHIEVVEAPAEPGPRPEPVIHHASNTPAYGTESGTGAFDDQSRDPHRQQHRAPPGSGRGDAVPGLPDDPSVLGIGHPAEPGTGPASDLCILRIDLIA